MFNVPCSESHPKGHKFNAQYYILYIIYYINDIFIAISDWRREVADRENTDEQVAGAF
jgi:hypothetical protein